MTTQTSPQKKTTHGRSTQDDPAHESRRAKSAVAHHAVILDDEPANRDFLMRLIEQANYTTHGASYGQEAIKVAEQLPTAPSIIVIDSQLPDINGTDLIKVFRERYPKAKLIMATMLDERNLMRTAFEHGCDVFLVKPHGFMELFKRLQSLSQDPTCLEQLVIDGNGVRPFKA